MYRKVLRIIICKTQDINPELKRDIFLHAQILEREVKTRMDNNKKPGKE